MISATNFRKRMTKGFALLMLFLLQTVASSAEVKISMEDFTISNGEYKQVALLLDNDKTATALEVHIDLPAGLYYQGGLSKTDRVKGRGADVQASTTTGQLVILVTDATIEPGTGEVVTFWVRNYNLAEGDHEIALSEIVVSDANAEQLNADDTYTAKVSVLGLSDCSFSGPEELSVVVGQEYQVDIALSNEGVYNLSAFQGKLTLPEGLEIVPGEDGKFIYTDRLPSPLEFKFQEYDGYTSFVLSSSREVYIQGIGGVIFSFKVKANPSLAENSEIKLSELRIAASTGQSALLEDVVIKVLNTTIAAEAAALEAANEKLSEVKAAAEELKVSDEAKAYDNETVKVAVANAEEAIAKVAPAIAAVEAVIAEGKLTTDNKEALEAAIAAADQAIADAQTAIAAAELAYADQKAADEEAYKKTLPGKIDELLDEIESGKATFTLDHDYIVKSPITIPEGKQLVVKGDGYKMVLDEGAQFQINGGIIIQNVDIDASAVNHPLIKLTASGTSAAGARSLGGGSVTDAAVAQEIPFVKVEGVTLNDLKAPLFYSEVKGYKINDFVINNCIIEVAADITVIDFTKGSAALNIEVSNSTIYATAPTTKSMYSSQGGEKADAYGATAENPQMFRFLNSTIYNFAKSKNFFSHRQSNQKWLGYEVKNSIFVDCGKSGQVIKGMNGGQSGKNPTWIIEKNTFNFDGADTSAAEDTADEDEPVKDNVVGVVEFADAANGDFTIGASTMQAREKTGDPRWLVEFVAPEVDKTALNTEIATAIELLGASATDEDPGKALKDAIDAAQTVADADGVFQEEVDAALAALKAAEEAFQTATGIANLKVDRRNKTTEVYNLSGQKVNTNYKGIVLMNGRKIIVKE